MTENTLTICINKKACEVFITARSFTFKQSEKETIVKSEDILGFDHVLASETRCVTMYYIHNGGHKLEKKKLKIEGPNGCIQRLVSMVTENISKVSGRPKSMVVFLNPHGGSANSETIFKRDIEVIFKLASIKYHLVVSESPNHPKEFASSFDFGPYDMLAIMGGDGTFNVIMNNLLRRQQSEVGIDVCDPNAALVPVDIPVAFIPGGTGNGMALIAYDGYDVVSAALHIIRGKTTSTSLLGNYCENKLVGYSFMMAATGMYVDLIKATERYRWMRKLRYIFVPAYYFLIRSHRRFDMEIEFENELELEDGTYKVDSEKEKDIIQETVISAFVMNTAFFAPKREKAECLYAIINKPTSKLQMIKNIAALIRTITREELEMNPSIIMKVVKGVKMRVITPDPDTDYSLNLDGEVYDMSEPKVYVKLIPNAYKLVTAQVTTEE